MIEFMEEWLPGGNQIVFEVYDAVYLMPYLATQLDRISWYAADVANLAIEKAMTDG
jgi:hypothetical protein